MKGEAFRPLVHASVGLGVFLTPHLGRGGMAAVAGAFVLVNAFLLPLTPFGRSLAREGEGRLGGLVTYPLAVALAYLLFPPWAAVVAWGTLAAGDPAAALVGRRAPPGGRRVPWNRRKSTDGLVAFWVGGVFFTACALQSLGGPLGIDTVRVVVAVLPVAVGLAALVETLPLPVDDNVPVALAAGGAALLQSHLLAVMVGPG